MQGGPPSFPGYPQPYTTPQVAYSMYGGYQIQPTFNPTSPALLPFVPPPFFATQVCLSIINQYINNQ